MANFFNSVRITNFKSLKDVTLSDCKRINLLIGKPNVGKSNILEAIGLFSLPYFKYNSDKSITPFVRMKELRELFFDGDFLNKQISIHADENVCTADFSIEQGRSRFIRFTIKLDKNGSNLDDNEILINLYDDLKLQSGNPNWPEDREEAESYVKQSVEDLKAKLSRLDPNSADMSFLDSIDRELNTIKILRENLEKEYYPDPKFKFYKFSLDFNFNGKVVWRPYLIPPSGMNLLDAIEASNIKQDLEQVFAEYGLKLLFDNTNNTLRVMKELKGGDSMVSLPYSSIADTLQRIIFFKTAIVSNKNSILLFEEPEAHCFPPYIAHFTQDVIDAETNQFFIATHSPYVLNDFLEYAETRAQLAIYMADFKDGQTVVYRLTDEELDEVYNYGLDVFFNYERFTEHG